MEDLTLNETTIKQLGWFLVAMIKVGIGAPEAEKAHGHPLARLIQQTAEVDSEELARRIFGRGDSGEYRLNSSGLKMYWANEDGRITITIGGDANQLRQYATTVASLRSLIDDRKLQPEA